MIADATLSVLKIAAGVAGHSAALVADGVHSVSDFVTDSLVHAFVGVTGRGINRHYRYGHGKFGTLAAFLISLLLLVVALGLLIEGVQDVIAAARGRVLERPSALVIVVAVFAIVVKELLYFYTRAKSRKTAAATLHAYSWHHQADALSTAAMLCGVAGARFLGEPWRVLDPIAAIIVSLIILVLAYRLGRPAAEELLEIALPDSEVAQIEDIIAGVDGVRAYHNLRTRRNGDIRVVDAHIKVDGNLNVTDSHQITKVIEQRLRDTFGEVITNIHVEPYYGNNHCESSHAD